MFKEKIEVDGYTGVVIPSAFGHYCGYVKLPQEHVLEGKGQFQLMRVHSTVFSDSPLSVNIFEMNPVSNTWTLVPLYLLVGVYGNLTYAAKDWLRGNDEDSWVFGFDAGHYPDAPNVDIAREAIEWFTPDVNEGLKIDYLDEVKALSELKRGESKDVNFIMGQILSLINQLKYIQTAYEQGLVEIAD